MPFPRLESEWERALAVDQAKLCDYLAHLCREIETNPGLVNFDRLMVLGIRVAAAGHEGADAFMLPWLAEAPSPRRLDIASAFLAGFWQAMASTSAYSVRPDLVNALIATRNSVTWDDTAAYSSLLALSMAITPGAVVEVKRSVLEAMKSAQDETYRHPESAKAARELIVSVMSKM